MIPTYNRTKYLEQTLKSVLGQDLGPDKMQIEVVDNCSKNDDSEAVVRDIGRSRVGFYCRSHHVNISANWNECINRARGQWIHILHDDDMVMPKFYEEYERLMRSYPDATLLTGPSAYVDEHNRQIGVSEAMSAQEGLVSDFALRQAIRNWIRAPSVVIPRRVFEEIGGFWEILSYTADWEMFFRIGLTGEVITTSVPYSIYRLHPDSDTNHLTLTGHNIQEAMFTVAFCCSRLSASLQRQLAPAKYRWLADLAGGFAYDLARKNLWKASLVHAMWAMRLEPCRKHLVGLLLATARYLVFHSLGPGYKALVAKVRRGRFGKGDSYEV